MRYDHVNLEVPDSSWSDAPGPATELKLSCDVHSLSSPTTVMWLLLVTMFSAVLPAYVTPSALVVEIVLAAVTTVAAAAVAGVTEATVLAAVVDTTLVTEATVLAAVVDTTLGTEAAA